MGQSSHAVPPASVVIAGHVCVDLHPHFDTAPRIVPGQLLDVGPLRIATGGCVANTGLDLAALGTPVRLVADVGDDDLGRLLALLLDRPGVDTSGVRPAPNRPTSYSVVIQPPDGDRTFWHHVGANADFTGDDVDLTGADLLHVGYPTILPGLYADGGAALGRLLRRARDAGVTTSLDLATVDPRSPAAACDWDAILGEVLPLVEVLAPSVDDLVSIGRPRSTPADMAAALVEAGVGVAVVKDGADGLHLRAGTVSRLEGGGRSLAGLAQTWAGADVAQPAVPVDVVGTTGAGDAAVAGLLHAIARGAGPEEAARTASLAAAARVSRTGHLPAAEELVAAVGARPAPVGQP